MLKKFDREDLDKLWSLVKETCSTTEVTDEKVKALWVELKRLYEHDSRDPLWALQRGGLLGIKCSKVFPLLEFCDSYKAPPEETAKDKGLPGEVSSSTKKKGRTVAITDEDMQKRKNDVKARTTQLLALPDEHHLRFSKYDSAKELWEAILKAFGGNEATKKTKKNQLKQQYGNFKDEGS
nr:xylulose kinase-1 [Tanacetum cinerariifolium]